MQLLPVQSAVHLPAGHACVHPPPEQWKVQLAVGSHDWLHPPPSHSKVQVELAAHAWLQWPSAQPSSHVSPLGQAHAVPEQISLPQPTMAKVRTTAAATAWWNVNLIGSRLPFSSPAGSRGGAPCELRSNRTERLMGLDSWAHVAGAAAGVSTDVNTAA